MRGRSLSNGELHSHRGYRGFGRIAKRGIIFALSMTKKKSIGFEEIDAKLDRVIGTLATKKDIGELNAKVDRVIDAMATKDDIARIEERMDDFDERLKRIIIALDHLKSGFDKMILEYAAISAKLARYEKWFEILAKKTGVKLTI
jgi:hypothetical protein